jgi:hypothetical protein
MLLDFERNRMLKKDSGNLGEDSIKKCFLYRNSNNENKNLWQI